MARCCAVLTGDDITGTLIFHQVSGGVLVVAFELSVGWLSALIDPMLSNVVLLVLFVV